MEILSCGWRFSQREFVGATTNSVVHVVWQAPGDGTSFGGPLGGIDFGASTDFISPWWTVTQSPTSRTQAAAATEGRSRATWDDGGARQHVFKFLNDTEHHYEFGAQALESWASDNPDYTRLTVGKNDFANANNYFYELIISDADEDASTLWAATKSNYGSLFSYADFILVVGDSITSATFPGLGDIWTRDFVTDQSISDMFIQSQGGWRLQDFLDIQDEAINWYVQNLTHTGDAIGIIFMGTNDLVLDEITGAACLVKLKSMASSMRTAGFDKIIATTMLPRNAGATFDTERDAFNVALKADSSGDFDEIADTTANANLEDETNTTYFNGDQVHLTDAGQLELSAVIQTAYEAATA